MLTGCVLTAPVQSAAKGNEEQNTVTAENVKKGAEDELIVTFKSSVSDSKIENAVESEDAQVEDIVKSGGLKFAQVSTDGDLVETAEELIDKKTVQSVQPNYKYTLYSQDPYLDSNYSAGYQYQFEATNAFGAWDEVESSTHSKTRVAVIDTGADLFHEDLQNNFVKENGKYKRFSYGDEIFDDDDTDYDGHGTHTSGLIGATFGNGLGGSGIAAGHNNDLVEVMPVGASPDGYNLFSFDVVKAIAYAADNGAKVVSMSFGAAVRDLAQEAAIKDAYYNHGVVFVAASGNEDNDGYVAPSDMKEVISVNASTKNNQPAYYSNYGTARDISAPGSVILSTVPGDDYDVLSGTSMATPIVAGIAALVLDANPNLTPAQVWNIICATAKMPEGITEEFDNSLAYGIIDAKAAVIAAKSASAEIPAEEVTMKSDSITVTTGDAVGAEALVKPASSLAPVTWSVGDESIAEIDPEAGIISGKRAGKTTVTATVSGKDVTQELIVEEEIKATDIKVKGLPENGIMCVDDMALLSVKTTPDKVSFNDFYYSSSDYSVLFASEGVLVAKKPGTAVLTVSNRDGSVSKDYTITVKEMPETISFTKKTNWIMLGESFTFEAKVYGKNGNTDVFNPEIKYTSSNPKIFTIDSKTGVAKAVSAGSAFVIAVNETSGLSEIKKLIVSKKDYKNNDYALKQTQKTANSITLKWNSVPIASGYVVEQKEYPNGKWKTVKTLNTNTTTFKQTKLKSGMLYNFRVKALYKKSGKTCYFSYSNTPLTATKANYNLKQSANTPNSITIKWNKQPAATGYVIEYRTSNKAKWKTLKTVSSKYNAYTHKKLKANQKVAYRIKAAYKVNKTVKYFEYSPAVTAKTGKEKRK